MKQFIFLSILCITFLASPVICQEPTDIKTDTTTAAVTTDNVPDTLFFNFDGTMVPVPIADIKKAIDQGSEIVITIREKVQENPPKGLLEWIFLIVSILASSAGLAFLTQVRKVGKTVITFFSKEMRPENFVILISGAIAAGISLLWNNAWNTIFFFGLWPTVFGVCTVVYLKFIKKDKEEEAEA